MARTPIYIARLPTYILESPIGRYLLLRNKYVSRYRPTYLIPTWAIPREPKDMDHNGIIHAG